MYTCSWQSCPSAFIPGISAQYAPEQPGAVQVIFVSICLLWFSKQGELLQHCTSAWQWICWRTLHQYSLGKLALFARTPHPDLWDVAAGTCLSALFTWWGVCPMQASSPLPFMIHQSAQ